MQNPAAQAIVLASSSEYRRTLLDRILTDYETFSPAIDETVDPSAVPQEFAARLARQKAEAGARQHHDALIIGADQVAVLDSQVLGKPGDHHSAVEQLLAAAGKTVLFFTAVCILDPVSRTRSEYVDKTIVRFRRFDLRLAESYVRHDEPYDCAGSFRIEGAGFVLFDSVSTDDPTALVGLPMIWISSRLQELGVLLR